MTDRSEAIVISLSPTRDSDRKVVLEPRSDGRYTLVEKSWDDARGRWRTTGTQDVDHVAVSTPCDDVLVPGATAPESAD